MFFSRIALALLLIEIFALFVIVGEIGFFATLGLWVLGALIGTWLIKAQGLATFGRAQVAFNRGELPVGDMFESLCIFGAGLLLIMPGFVSDAFAIALLVPAFQNLLQARSAKSFVFKQNNTPSYEDGVIDGVYERVPERTEQIAAKNIEN